MRPSPTILYEDNHLLALAKPAGWIVQGASEDADSLLAWARDDLKRRYAKPGNVYLGVVHRIDGPVTGVVLFAKTSKAAARLSAQFRDRTVTKTYLAIVAGRVDPPAGTWTDEMTEHDGRPAIVPRRRSAGGGRPAEGVRPGPASSRAAVLHYRAVKSSARHTLLEIEPVTGRKHQIRLQAAAHGHPILGDIKYGGEPGRPGSIALHARRLTIAHPVREERLTIAADVPATWALRDE